MKTPLVLVTGYLGAGKTTLVRNLLEQAGDRRIAVMMNEFGEVDIDGRAIGGTDVDMIEMAGGCVCCSIRGDLENALQEVIEEVDPEMIVLETTGVAEPDAIIGLVDMKLENVEIDSVVTVVDCDALVKSPQIGHTGRVQIEMADVLLLNKIDLVEREQVDEIEEKVREINNGAQLYRTVEADIDWNLLLGLYSPKEVVEHKEEHLEVGSFVLDAAGEFDREKFEEFARYLPGEVYRAKGFIQLGGTPYLFNYVNGNYDLEERDEAGESKLVFIGKGVEERKGEIEEGLRNCGE